jgi:bacillithiol system protein YtxJ
MLSLFKNQSNLNWLDLNSFSQIESLIEDNKRQKDFVFAIFKHSTRCSISSVAKRRLEKDWVKSNPDIPLYYLDLIQYRGVSDQIADFFKVRHQSPQILVIKNGLAVYNESHLSISPKLISSNNLGR